MRLVNFPINFGISSISLLPKSNDSNLDILHNESGIDFNRLSLPCNDLRLHKLPISSGNDGNDKSFNVNSVNALNCVRPFGNDCNGLLLISNTCKLRQYLILSGSSCISIKYKINYYLIN